MSAKKSSATKSGARKQVTTGAGAAPAGPKRPGAKKPGVRTLVIWAVGLLAVSAAVFALAMPAPSQLSSVGNDQLVRLQADGALVVDVRTPSEFEAGHIASALSVPLDTLEQAAANWDKSQPIVVYCATGARSAEAAAILGRAGFKKIYDLTAGVVAWNGTLVGGRSQAAVPGGAGTVKTEGRPMLIEFATST